jgi:GH25 family lysozyme M1 (1,4-beta-N-acetylmuramidase)
MEIMDVSRWQGRIDWDKVKASGKIDGVMLRALGYKGSKPYVDPTFERNYAACAALGIPVGVYFWLGSTVAGGMANTTAMLRSVLEGKNFQLPIAIDVEDPKLKVLTPAELSALVRLYAAEIESWGLYAMVYTYTNFADTALDMDALAAYDLWIADYRSMRPTRKHGMWQYTSEGRIPGVSGPVDLSHAYKDYPAIIRRAGLDKLKGA